MKKLLLISLFAFSALNAADKVYIDEDELKSSQDAFYVHLGHNVWMHTNHINRDETGLYVYEHNIARSMTMVGYEYEKKWRCPYCYSYWPQGTACQNKDCPSRYKMGMKK